MAIRVVDAKTRHPYPGIPTPGLCDAASRAPSAEAYFVEDTGIKSGGVWYLRDATHTSPDGEYTQVRVEQFEEWTVDVHIKPVGPDSEEAYDDWFVVEARNEQEAFQLANEAAHEDVERRFGDEYGSDVTTVRAIKGGLSEMLARR